MLSGHVTTPFGRRPVKLALVKRQIETASMREGKTADKWKVFRDACEARKLLGVQDRPLAVLNALLTFYPETELSEARGLIVFPSNVQLAIRSHGISGATLRRAIAALVEAGLIERHDSPNGKRYAHRDRAGEVEQAFGFSLAPLLARAGELAVLAQRVAEENRAFKRRKEELSLCRRDVRKLISAAMEEGAEGDWQAIEAMYVTILSRLPRNADRPQVETTLEEMTLLRDEIVNLLEIQIKAKKMHTDAAHIEQHIQNSNTESNSELELSFETKQGAKPRQEPSTSISKEKPKAFPLSLVLRACPLISDYAPEGSVAHWRDLMAAAVVARSTLGVSPSAYQEACEIMGTENAAIAMACILERAGHINSAGGYLRDLTRRTARGEFSLGPMLMALLRMNGGVKQETG